MSATRAHDPTLAGEAHQISLPPASRFPAGSLRVCSSAQCDRVKAASGVRDGDCSFWQLVWKHAEDPAVPMAVVLLAARLDATWQHWALRRGPAEAEGGEEERRLVQSGEEALELSGQGLTAYVQYVMDVVLAGETLWPDDETHRGFLENLAEGGQEVGEHTSQMVLPSHVVWCSSSEVGEYRASRLVAIRVAVCNNMMWA